MFGKTNEIKSDWIQFTELCEGDILKKDIHGYVIYNSKNQRTKIRNITFEKIKYLVGNSQKIQHRYYTLRNNNQLNQFLDYFPELSDKFKEYQKSLYIWTEGLYSEYIDCFIYKNVSLKIVVINTNQFYMNFIKIILKN